MLRISPRNKKVPFPNLSHAPIKGCGNCRYCAKDCYAMKAYRQYPRAASAWDVNLTLWQNAPDQYASDLLGFLEKTKATAFRFFVAGDMPSQDYIDRVMIPAAQSRPDIRFLSFTKMHGLDFADRPPNLQIVFSQWPGMRKSRRVKGIRFAWIQDGTEKRIPKRSICCPGDCRECQVCWSLYDTGRDVYFNIH